MVLKSNGRISQTFSFLIAFGCFALLAIANHASGKSSSPLIEKLDSHYYYPQREGIKKLSFSIHWARLDPFAEADDKKLLNNPTVRFSWKTGMNKPDFELDSSVEGVSPFRELEILKFMSQYAEVFLPVPLSQTLEDYSFKGKKQHKNFLEARFGTDTPHQVMQYDFRIDSKRWVIQTLRTQQQHSPFHVTSHLKYVDREGKWQVLESRSRFVMNGQQYEEVMEFFYKQIEGYWLPTRVRQQLKEGTKLANSYIFTFADYKIN